MFCQMFTKGKYSCSKKSAASGFPLNGNYLNFINKVRWMCLFFASVQVCVCVDMRLFVCMCLYECLCVCMSAWVCIWVCVHLRVRACVFISVGVCLFARVCACVRACMRVCLNVCLCMCCSYCSVGVFRVGGLCVHGGAEHWITAAPNQERGTWGPHTSTHRHTHKHTQPKTHIHTHTTPI